MDYYAGVGRRSTDRSRRRRFARMPSHSKTMGSRRHDVQPGSSAPRIYLIVPCAEYVVAPMDELAAALDAADIAAVLVASADMNEQALIDRIMMLAPVVQTRGVALLLQAD